MNTRNTSENELVRRIRAIGTATSRLNSAVRLGIGDDAALFSPRRGYETILTCDWFLERTHFLRDKHPADSVGWKCLARAVSDIAAMGGEPRCFLLSLALPETHAGRWLDEFLAGLRRAATKVQVPISGRRHYTPRRNPNECHGRRRSSIRPRTAAIRRSARRHYLCERPPGRSRARAATPPKPAPNCER